MERRSILAALLGSTAAIPLVAALQGPSIKDASQALITVGQALNGFLKNEYALYTITILFSFILFYAVYAAPARRLRFFEGQGGLGLNSMGKLFCFALSGLTCTAIFAFQDNVTSATKRFLLPFGVYGAIVFSIVAFILIYRGFRDQQFLGLGNLALGFLGGISAFLFFSFLIGDQNMIGFGILFFGIFLICLILRAFWGFRHRGVGRRAVRREEHIAEREEHEVEQVEGRQAQEYAAELAELRQMQARQGQQLADHNATLRQLIDALRREQ